VPTVAVALALVAASPMTQVGVLLAGVITGCWLAAGVAGMAAVARRASKRGPRARSRRRPRRPGGVQGRGLLLLWLFGLTATVMPLLLVGWSGWWWSVLDLALVGVGLGAVWLAERGGNRLVMLAVVACLAGAGFLMGEMWWRLLQIDDIGTALAVCLAVLVAVLLLAMFAVSVREAAARTLAWCRQGGDGRWLLIAGVGAVTVLLPVLAGLQLWVGLSGAVLLATSIGMFQLGDAEGGDGHVLSLLAAVVAGLYLALLIMSGAMSWQRLFL
jgi:hypothetical protein